ncbi:radical SAM protein [Candidatus Lokiarchaeum ossiferum]|uniref:radical SAM protein n=1 Tax=Candidatus Lokiarchaeum ossiferum TaxID=2951803 RepID=UPI00352DA04A
MLIKKIIFLEPKTENLHIYSKFELPRLGSVLLATIMKQEGYLVEAYFLKTNEIIERNLDADLIAISSITPTITYAFRLADYFREKGIPVVIGGPHVTALPNEALDHCDFVIRGEGEIPLPKLVSELNNNMHLEEVPSLSWINKGEITHNDLCRPIENLDSLPFPDFSLLDNGGKAYNGITRKMTIPIQASRGCPFNCKFCSVTSMFGKKFRFRSVESIISEMKRYNPKKDILFFYDDNFSANKTRTKQLLRAMISHQKEFGGLFQWVTQVRIDIAKDSELMDLLKESGCMVLFIGIESVNPEALKEMKKAQSIQDIQFGIKEIRKRGIHIHGMFVFGFDSDNIATTQSTVDFAIKSKIGSAQFLILTPLPGTEFFKQMIEENRLLEQNWEKYDTHHVNFIPKQFSLWDLQQTQIMAHDQFYKFGNVFRRFIRGNLISLFIGLYAHKLNKKWVKGQQKYLDRIKKLLIRKKKHFAIPPINDELNEEIIILQSPKQTNSDEKESNIDELYH